MEDLKGLLLFLLVGLVAGWIASRVMGGPGGLVRSLIIGVIGALLGGFLFRLANIHLGIEPLIAQLIVATIGAVLFIFLWRRLKPL